MRVCVCVHAAKIASACCDQIYAQRRRKGNAWFGSGGGWFVNKSSAGSVASLFRSRGACARLRLTTRLAALEGFRRQKKQKKPVDSLLISGRHSASCLLVCCFLCVQLL